MQNAPVVLQIVISLPCRGLRGAQVWTVPFPRHFLFAFPAGVSPLHEWLCCLPRVGRVCGVDFLGCTECWPCISGALCLRGGLNIYSLAGREGMQISLSSHRNPPAVRIAAQVFILWMCSNLE